MCESEEENLKHFLLHCQQYSDIRKEYTFMQQPYKADTDEHLADILLFTTDNSESESEKIDKRKTYLKKIWKERQRVQKTRTQEQTQ